MHVLHTFAQRLNEIHTNVGCHMAKSTTKAKNSPILPAQEYYFKLNRAWRSVVLSELMLTIDKSQATIWRWFHGVLRPDKAHREKVAFTLGKIMKTKFKGDELFPENYPYTGTHNK